MKVLKATALLNIQLVRRVPIMGRCIELEQNCSEKQVAEGNNFVP